MGAGLFCKLSHPQCRWVGKIRTCWASLSIDRLCNLAEATGVIFTDVLLPFTVIHFPALLIEQNWGEEHRHRHCPRIKRLYMPGYLILWSRMRSVSSSLPFDRTYMIELLIEQEFLTQDIFMLHHSDWKWSPESLRYLLIRSHLTWENSLHNHCMTTSQ